MESNGSNLVDIRSILVLLTQYLNRTTDSERVFFALEISRIFSNFSNMEIPSEQKNDHPKLKVKLI